MQAGIIGAQHTYCHAELCNRHMRQARVPSSPIGRVVGFAGLGASLALGALRDNASLWLSGAGGKSAGGDNKVKGNPWLTERNAERLADALCRMRQGARSPKRRNLLSQGSACSVSFRMPMPVVVHDLEWPCGRMGGVSVGRMAGREIAFCTPLIVTLCATGVRR